ALANAQETAASQAEAHKVAAEATDKELANLRGEAGKRGDAVTALTAEKKTLTDALAAQKTAQAEEGEALRAEIKKLRDALANAQEAAASQAEAHKVAAEATDKELANLRGEASKRGDAVTALTAEKKTLTDALEHARRQSKLEQSAALKQAEDLRAELADLTRKLDASDAAQSRLAREIAEITAQNREQANQLAQAAVQQADYEQAHMAQVKALTASLEANETELDKSKAARQTLQHSLSETQSALRQRQLETEETAAALAEIRQELKAAQTELDELRQMQIDDRAALEAARQTATVAQAAEAERYDEIADLTQVLIDREEMIAAQTAHIHSVESAFTSLNDAMKTMKQEAVQSTAAIARLRQDLIANEKALATIGTERQNLQHLLLETQGALHQRQREAEETAVALAATRQALETADAELEHTRRAQAEDRAALEAVRHAADVAETERQARIMDLTQSLAQREMRIDHLMHLTEEGRSLSERIDHAINAILIRPERRWISGKRQLARKAALLRESGMFDAQWYGLAHPDVTQAGEDPAIHYIQHGRAEGRHPLPDLARFMATLPKANPPEN
ncbi:hypothetical protein ACHT3C_19460, partial [Sphingobium sp. R-7]